MSRAINDFPGDLELFKPADSESRDLDTSNLSDIPEANLKITLMKHTSLTTTKSFFGLSIAALSLLSQAAFGQGDSLKTDLVSYWPLDVVEGNKTPDLASGYDFTLSNMDAGDLIPGKTGMAFTFDGSQAHLVRVSDPADDLPAAQHDSFTIAFWARANGVGQNDRRLFSESNTSGNNTPLFNLGTHRAGSTAQIDVFIRQGGSTTVDHIFSDATPLDGLDWHHIAFVQTLQGDESSTRQLYIDGVLDPLAIPNKPAGLVFDMNTTTVGAILRGSISAPVVGDVDEVAIWKRDLTQAEITDLVANGMPDLDEQQEELVIRDFSSEFHTVINGDQVLLSWDVTKDATITIDQGIGDVTGISDFGVGSTSVTINAPTTFTLTASREGDAPLTSEVTVTPISGVASGWNWIEDFNSYANGALLTQGGWLDAEGDYDVTTIGTTQALIQTAGTDLTGRPLGTHTVAEDTSRTLFFRFCASELEPDLPLNIKVGLSEKSLRFATDWNTNSGTYVIFSREALGTLQLQAIDGIGGAPVDSGIVIEPNTVYNVWIDVINNTLGGVEPDRFSVHVAPDGGSRTTVFDNFTSDRAPGNFGILGPPRAPIDQVFLASTTDAGQASQAVVFDDFYISPEDTFLSTLPVPSGFGKAPLGPPFISDIVYDPDTQKATLTWDSRPDTVYSAFYSETLTPPVWFEINDNIPSGGLQTIWEADGTFPEDKLFFKVQIAE